MELPIGQWLSAFNHTFTLYLVFPMLLLFGVYLTLRLRGLQVSKLKLSFYSLFRKDPAAEGNVSQYQAVASVLASNFGTGNISGMAIALATGGPGAVVWMWVMAFLGSAIQYASCLLGVKYRQKNAKGEFVGGPMYYIAQGLKWKKVAMLFSLMTVIAAFGAGNFVQVNSVVLPFTQFGISAWVLGLILAVLVGIVVLGGAQRVAHVSSAVVPIMAFLYLGGTCWILASHAELVVPSLMLMLKSAFGFSALAGGVFGYTVLKALSSGFDRAIFATDAGTGIVPILQADAKASHPVANGIISLLPPFLVMFVCTATALALMVTGAWNVEGLQSTNMVIYAFNSVLGEKLGSTIVLLALFLFGYTTTIAWASCLQRAVGFLWGDRFTRFFQILYIAMVPIGAILKVDFVWIFADIALTGMLVLNLCGVIGLSPQVIADTRSYFSPAFAKSQIK